MRNDVDGNPYGPDYGKSNIYDGDNLPQNTKTKFFAKSNVPGNGLQPIEKSYKGDQVRIIIKDYDGNTVYDETTNKEMERSATRRLANAAMKSGRPYHQMIAIEALKTR